MWRSCPKSHVTTLDGALADIDSSKVIRNAVYGYQHNDVFDSDLKYWTHKISDLDAPAKGGGVFRIGRAPIYAGLFQKQRAPLPLEMQRHARQQGLVVSDADLLFSSSNGKIEVRNPNPLKGLVENKPWDFQLTTSGLSSSVEMAAICPVQDAAKLKRFLNQFQERSEPAKPERDYFQDFPGFSAAFGLPLTYPNRGESGWIDLDDVVAGDALTSAKQLAHRICKALDVIRSIRPGAIAAIFVPFRWAEYEKIEMTNGKPEIDKFPIPRGAVVILDKTSALLWVHGVTPNAMNPSWKYYQGKRRIPTPLLIRRYRGQSDITQVATEILGLSKMNWNTFDYYSRLPATLDSASAIAKVGAYLSGFGSARYDYRLLI